MKLIVSDLDGTLLNSRREVSKVNAAALLAAQRRGIEIAVATGRIYGNALAVCRRAGLTPHIISNNGAFVYTKDGRLIQAAGLDKKKALQAVEWLQGNGYFYDVCTDRHMFIPPNAREVLLQDFESAAAAGTIERELTAETARQEINRLLSADGVVFAEPFEAIWRQQDLIFGNVSAITFNREKLQRGRDFFGKYEGMAMTIAGREIFEMIAPAVSKGNALEKLAAYLGIGLSEVMAFGDNYNDISMLSRVGISVAIGNAEEAVKKICRYIAPANDADGVAHMIDTLLAGVKMPS
ncbi:cof protein [Lucifera butyrica]|uniref:Cof protein n=1 Tax=Lucifera butyrica TaxID=1351585 RepID=A0A498RL94_9FIRM|nr:HAD family hydrolase [Lucifera butyrica]VBB09828.1 cof protein [Lucifera butyrica]